MFDMKSLLLSATFSNERVVACAHCSSTFYTDLEMSAAEIRDRGISSLPLVSILASHIVVLVILDV